MDEYSDPAPKPYAAAQMHSPTSIAAAQVILPKAGTLRRMVYDLIVLRGNAGATDDELQRWGLDPSTERPRRCELVEAGLVEDSGHRRKTRSGRLAVVWRAR